jgi:putative transcriptional regulator
MDVYERFRLRMKQLRGEQGMTQQDLADKLGVTVQYLMQIEKGTCAPHIIFAVDLAKALDASLDSFFCDEEQLRKFRLEARANPKKPDKIHRKKGQCPCCGGVVYYSENTWNCNRFCHHCGQALRWP